MEGALALQVRQGEDGAQAVVVVGAGGERGAFGDAGVLVGEWWWWWWWCEWMGEGQGVDVSGEEEDGEDGEDGEVERWMHAVCLSLSTFSLSH